jgi:hypothetical protein
MVPHRRLATVTFRQQRGKNPEHDGTQTLPCAKSTQRRAVRPGAARSGDRSHSISAQPIASLDEARFVSGYALADRPAQCLLYCSRDPSHRRHRCRTSNSGIAPGSHSHSRAFRKCWWRKIPRPARAALPSQQERAWIAPRLTRLSSLRSVSFYSPFRRICQNAVLAAVL